MVSFGKFLQMMKHLAQVGSVPRADLERTWNCGIGMVAVIDKSALEMAQKTLAARGMNTWVAGVVEKK
jgi:phosphoribosylformylglycinamidine cyclo-ligase